MSRGLYFHVSAVEARNLLNAACYQKNCQKVGIGLGVGVGWEGGGVGPLRLRPQEHKDSNYAENKHQCLRYHAKEL